MKIVFAVVVSLFVPILSPAQKLTTWDKNVVTVDAPIKGEHFNRFFRYVGRHSLGTFTDLGRDKQWAIAFTIDSLAQTADIVTTCRGLNRGGFQEANPIFFHTRNCTQLAIGASALHLVKWTATHAMVHEFVQQCWYWSGQKGDRWAESKPSSCRETMWAGVVTTPFHIRNSITNEQKLP